VQSSARRPAEFAKANGVLSAKRPGVAEGSAPGASNRSVLPPASPLIPVPAFAPLGVTSPPLYRAQLPPGYAEAGRMFFSENAVTMNSMVLVLPKQADYKAPLPPYNNDALAPRHIAQAALKANPRIQFVVPTSEPFSSPSDPRFVQTRASIAQRLGVPAESVFPARATLGWFPQDEFMAGPSALAKPLGRNSVYDYRRTAFGTNQLARELGLPAALSPAIGRGGDTHIVSRGGQQFAYFSQETVLHVAEAHGLNLHTPQNHLLAIAVTMKQMAESGVPVGNIMTLGRTGQDKTATYGSVLQTLSPSERARIAPDVLAQIERMRKLPFPRVPYEYHSDVFTFTPDGRKMFVREMEAADPQLNATLRFFGFETVRLPGGRIINPQDEEAPLLQRGTEPLYLSADVPQRARLMLNYNNMVQGRLPDGRQAILMPTEALDPQQLSLRDQQVLALLQRQVPGAVIVPMGGRSALVGNIALALSPMPGGAEVDKDWGAHCMSNVLPYVLELASPGLR
jgi:hypothetical protein